MLQCTNQRDKGMTPPDPARCRIGDGERADRATRADGSRVTKSEIEKRLGQITFNAPLQKELAAINLASKLIRTEEGARHSRLAEKIDALRLQRISAEEHVEGLSELSALDTDAGFLLHLRDRGRAAADAWLTAESDALDDAVAA